MILEVYAGPPLVLLFLIQGLLVPVQIILDRLLLMPIVRHGLLGRLALILLRDDRGFDLQVTVHHLHP